MSMAAVVLVCALDLLGRSASQFPRIEILEQKPRSVSTNATAFADLDARVIYLIATEPPFSIARAAQTSPDECREPDALRLVAGTIVHEEWHLRHGRDERGAYYAQLMALQLMGLGPGTSAYRGVKLSMNVVLAAQASRRLGGSGGVASR
jgi:hypothetical protein